MKIVDLFSGAGGLTFGFYYKLENDGFVKNNDNEFIFANEINPDAVTAFKLNYPDIPMEDLDIKKLKKEKINELIANREVDLIIGGPPCQSFSTVGQRRFDDKAKLYKQYIRILREVRPKMFLFENVKGLLSMKEIFYKKDDKGEIIYEIIESKRGKKPRKRPVIDHYGDLIIKKIRAQFEKIGYVINYKVLNAVHFGVPQNRERVFIVGHRKELGIDWEFPVGQEAPISIKDAISDLPILPEGGKSECYLGNALTEYQRLMRGNNQTLTCHYCGVYGDKIRTVIQNVKQGQGKEDFNELVDNGIFPEEYRLTSGYKNTYGRLVEDQPSTTITNNMCTPSGLRCIHYAQNRALSPREGARIQSFPDWFQFVGPRTEMTKQIGNAVPPLLAMIMARKIEEVLGGI